MKKNLTTNASRIRIPLIAAGLAIGAAAATAADTAFSPDAHIFGFNGYTNTSSEEAANDYGWYRIGPNGEENQIWFDSKYGPFGTYFNVGYIRDGKLCGYYGNASQVFYVEFDVANGKQVKEEEFDVQGANAYKHLLSGAYNRADDCVYGFSLSVDRSKMFFVKAPASDPMDITIVREMPEYYGTLISCCFSSKDNHMYGIDSYGDLIRADVYGNFETLAELKDMDYDGAAPMAGWESGMVYSPKDNAFLWNRHYSNYNSSFVKIPFDAPYKWSLVTELPWCHQFTILDCTDTDGDDNGPVAADFVSADFGQGATSGTIVYTMPSKLADGTDAPASMTWTATVGDKTLSGTAAPGTNVHVNYTDVAKGEANFAFRANAGDAKGASKVVNMWIGADKPCAPSDVKLEKKEGDTYRVSWKAPTEGAHKGYLDAKKLRYGVFLDNEQIGVATDKLEAEITLPSDQETRDYQVYIYAVADGLTSEGTGSNKVFTGRGYNIPYSCIPTVADAEKMTIINIDDDKSRWAYTVPIGETQSTFFTNRDWDNAGDDYLITPPLWMDDAQASYKISFDVRYHNPLKAEEYFDVWLGTAPTEDGIREKRVAPKTLVTSRSYYNTSFDFNIPSAGTYYLGIHYTGDADQGGIYVCNIKVTKEGTNAVETIDAAEGTSVRSMRGAIVLTAADATAEVFAADGRKVARADVKGNATVNVPAGIYIVRMAGRSFKVRVG